MKTLETKMITGAGLSALIEAINEYIDGRPAEIGPIQKDGNTRYATVNILERVILIAGETLLLTKEAPPVLDVVTAGVPVGEAATTSLDSPTDEDDGVPGPTALDSIWQAITNITLRADFSGLSGQDVAEYLWITIIHRWETSRDYRIMAAVDTLTRRADEEFGPTIKDGLVLLRKMMVGTSKASVGTGNDNVVVPEGTFKQSSKSMPSTGGYPT